MTMPDEPQRHRIQVVCPECGHRQSEPALVISTQCRNCYRHYAVKNGVGIPRTQSTLRIAKVRPEDDLAELPPAPRVSAYRPAKPPPPKKPLLLRLLSGRKKAREILCFGCAHEFTAIPEARSSQCPKCGCYISLEDHVIEEKWKRRILTRGNVTIRKTGWICETSVECHHLTIAGKIDCDADCSGDIRIQTNGKFTGYFRCRHLYVEKSCRVEFLHPVIARSATIMGDVRGHLDCTGPVVLEKNARFHGLIRTPSLTVKPGAIQNGTVEKPPLNEQSSTSA